MSIPNFQSGVLDINGARIYCEEAGEGPALIMVHAGVADLRMWDDQFTFFADHYRVIRFDQRGFGRSEMPEGDFSPGDDLLGVMDALHLEQAALMGCSMGGAAIIDFAVQRPERVAALIPVASGLSGFQFEGNMPPGWAEMEQAEKAGDLDTAAEYAVRIWLDSRHRTPDQVDPALREKLREMARGTLESAPGRKPPRQLTPPAVDRLESLRIPTLVIAGDLDDKNIQRAADFIAFSIPGAKKVIMSGTAHFPNMERPQEFNQVVNAFLSSVYA